MSKDNGVMGVEIDATTTIAEWVIDLDAIKVKEESKFLADLERTQSEKKLTAILPWLTRVVRAWPFEGLNPQKLEDYQELGLKQRAEVLKQFLSAFRRLNEL